jgi:CDP-diacylglycerol--serine O-phosphatidyltransferase
MAMTFLTMKMLREVSHKQRNLLPCSFTLLNACFGFFSVVAAAREEYWLAAFYIIMAVIMDTIDGRVARALGVSSTLGMELDSLCDAVSFCMAPALIIFSWCDGFESPQGLAVLFIYLLAGLIRLARFNIIGQQDISFIKGLPTPIAALVCAAIIMALPGTETTCRIVTLVLISLAILMVSPIPFISFKKVSKTFMLWVALLSIMSFLLIYAFTISYSYLLLLGLSCYIGCNLLYALCKYIQRFLMP